MLIVNQLICNSYFIFLHPAGPHFEVGESGVFGRQRRQPLSQSQGQIQYPHQAPRARRRARDTTQLGAAISVGEAGRQMGVFLVR